MAKYQRPCCILTKVEDTYQGSARGCDKTGINNFKDICESTGVIMYAEGHQGAFGLGIESCFIDDFIKRTDEALKNTSEEPVYFVDYIYEGVNIKAEDILDIVINEESYGIILKAIDNLSDTYQAVCKLKYINGLKEREIAEVLDLPEKTVNQRIFRGKQILREALIKEQLHG